MESEPEQPLEAIEHPCLRCVEHEGVCEVIHSIYGRLLVLEQRVKMLEEGK